MLDLVCIAHFGHVFSVCSLRLLSAYLTVSFSNNWHSTLELIRQQITFKERNPSFANFISHSLQVDSQILYSENPCYRMKPNRQRTRHHMTKSTSSLNNHQATLPVRGARPLPPWKEVFPPSFSPMGITAECFPFLLNVYPGGHGGGVISEVQWAKTAACTFLPTPDRWTLSMSVMSVLLTHTKAAPLALAELLLKFTPPLPKKRLCDKHQTDFTSASWSRMSGIPKGRTLLNTAHVWPGRWQSHNATILASQWQAGISWFSLRREWKAQRALRRLA